MIQIDLWLLPFTSTTKGLQKCSQVEAMMPDVCMEFFKEGPIYPFKEKACKNWIENNQETLNEIETKCNLGELIYYYFKFRIEKYTL